MAQHNEGIAVNGFYDMSMAEADAIYAGRWVVHTGLGPWWFGSEAEARAKARSLRGVTWVTVKRG